MSWTAIVVALIALIVGLLIGVVAGRLARAARRRPAEDSAATSADPDSTETLPIAPGRDDDAPHRVGQPLASLVVEALDHGVIVLDRDERAVLVNPAARNMGVLDIDKLVFTDLISLTRRSLESAAILTASIDLPIGRLGREPIALSVTAVPLQPGSDDWVAGVCLLLADISESRRLEAVRRDFVANVSHELKTPVGALTLLAEAIQDAADEPAVVNRFAARIQHEGSRLAKLVGELMELSRVQGMDPMPDATEVAVCDILAAAHEHTKLAAEQASIVVSLTCEDGLAVRGNESQLVSAVTNLVDNAIAYSGGGTKVAVSARTSSDVDGRPTVDVSVTDQGIGIAEAERDRIFERFYRIDPARSRVTGGTGLGLAIVKNIVTNHLGTVHVWSAERSGSTFTIQLPRVHSDRPSSAASGNGGSPNYAGHRPPATRRTVAAAEGTSA